MSCKSCEARPKIELETPLDLIMSFLSLFFKKHSFKMSEDRIGVETCRSTLPVSLATRNICTFNNKLQSKRRRLCRTRRGAILIKLISKRRLPRSVKHLKLSLIKPLFSLARFLETARRIEFGSKWFIAFWPQSRSARLYYSISSCLGSARSVSLSDDTNNKHFIWDLFKSW